MQQLISPQYTKSMTMNITINV